MILNDGKERTELESYRHAQKWLEWVNREILGIESNPKYLLGSREFRLLLGQQAQREQQPEESQPSPVSQLRPDPPSEQT